MFIRSFICVVIKSDDISLMMRSPTKMRMTNISILKFFIVVSKNIRKIQVMIARVSCVSVIRLVVVFPDIINIIKSPMRIDATPILTFNDVGL